MQYTYFTEESISTAALFCIYQHDNWLSTITSVSHVCSKVVIALQNILVKSQGSTRSQHKSQELFGHHSCCGQSGCGRLPAPWSPPRIWVKHRRWVARHSFWFSPPQLGRGWSSCLREVGRFNWTDTKKGILPLHRKSGQSDHKVDQQGLIKRHSTVSGIFSLFLPSERRRYKNVLDAVQFSATETCPEGLKEE